MGKGYVDGFSPAEVGVEFVGNFYRADLHAFSACSTLFLVNIFGLLKQFHLEVPYEALNVLYFGVCVELDVGVT